MEQDNDYIVRGTAAGGQIRCFAITSKNLVEEARDRHQTSPVITAALGRLLSAGAMMGSMMKGKNDLLTLQITCNGPVRGLTVTSGSAGGVKGYAINPTVSLPASPMGKLDVGKALGQGVLTVTKDIGMKEPYSGQVQLVSGEIAEDLTYYFATSEQTPSSVSLGVLMNKNNTVAQAGGYILQLMPDTQDELIQKLEERLSQIEPVTTLLSQGNSPETMLRHILNDFDVTFSNETIPASFSCSCSRERMKQALVSLGHKELTDIVADGEPIEVHCHFCNTNYNFGIEELVEIKKSCEKKL